MVSDSMIRHPRQAAAVTRAAINALSAPRERSASRVAPRKQVAGGPGDAEAGGRHRPVAVEGQKVSTVVTPNGGQVDAGVVTVELQQEHPVLAQLGRRHGACLESGVVWPQHRGRTGQGDVTWTLE